MLKKTIKYTDYNGVAREETFFFNLSPAEVAEMELTTTGGMSALIEKIIDTQDTAEITKIFKRFILASYGEKSDDGKNFFKKTPDGYKLADKFEQSEAYSTLFMELASDADAAVKFITGIMPPIPEDRKPAVDAEINKRLKAMGKDIPAIEVSSNK